MAEFGGHKSTKAGQNLQATLFATKRPLQYSSVKVGDGQLAGKVIADLTSLVKVRLSLPITQTPRKNQDGRWDITAVLSNRELTEPMKFREWGVFATDPDTNAEVLIAYANAGESSDILNPWDGTTVSTLIEQEITCACLVTGDLTVQAITVDPTQLYTTRQVFDAHNIDMGHHLIPCTAAYDTVTKRHTLTPIQTGITLPDIFTARFLATTAFTAGDKVYIGGAEYVPSYTDGDTAVETGVWISNAVVSLDCKKAGLKAYVGAGFGKQLSQKVNGLDASKTIYVAKTGSDTTGDGTTEKPFLTIQHAISILPSILNYRVYIYIRAGIYDENVTLGSKVALDNVFIEGVNGDVVAVKTLLLQRISGQSIINNLKITGNSGDVYNWSIQIGSCSSVVLENITCTEPVATQSLGSARIENSFVTFRNTTISNKQIALDVSASTVYLTDTDTGVNNVTAIRCGSGWSSFGGYVQKGGATIVGAEEKSYGGQIW